MYLSELKLWNFRKYGIIGETFNDSKPGLTVQFLDGVNVLIGENNSGKTTIVDANRYILKTQSGEPIYVDEKDFYERADGRASELRIECSFKGFSHTDAGHFLEWIGFEPNNAGENEYVLKIWLQLTDSKQIYEIFKPLNEGKVSKASTAQYLAEILNRTNETERIMVINILKTDPFLKYLRDAIYYVTKQEP